MKMGKPRYIWLKGLLATGLFLSLLLLVQSAYTYYHVSRQLVSDQLTREAERQVVAVDRGLRVSEASNAEQQHIVLEDILQDNAAKISWMRIIDPTGKAVVEVGAPAGPPLTAGDARVVRTEPGSLPELRDTPKAGSWSPSCRCAGCDSGPVRREHVWNPSSCRCAESERKRWRCRVSFSRQAAGAETARNRALSRERLLCLQPVAAEFDHRHPGGSGAGGRLDPHLGSISPVCPGKATGRTIGTWLARFRRTCCLHPTPRLGGLTLRPPASRPGRSGGTFTTCSRQIKITSRSCSATWRGKACPPRC